MVTPADFAAFQQQVRQEVADVIQQLRAEVSEIISSRMNMMNSISAALQRVSARSTECKPYRISDLIPRNWECNNEKEEFRSFMSDLHGCKRGQTKENRCLLWWEVLKSLTAT